MGFVLLLIGIIALAGFFFYASWCIGSNVYIKTCCKKRTSEKIVSLTFDDGPHPVYTPLVLDILKQHNISATFFCIGKEAGQYPELVKRMHKEGHLIGNHSFCHTSYFPLFGKKRMEADIRKCETILEQLTDTPVRFFRPPFGVTNPTIAKVIKKMNYTTIGWSIRSFDTRKKDSPEKIFSRITHHLSTGDIILLHDRVAQSPDVLIRLIEYLQEKQYKIVRVDELLEI